MPRVKSEHPLRAWRLENELTLEDVHGLTGVSIPMLSRVERGQRSMAPLTRAVVARRLGVAVAQLFPVEELPEDPSGGGCAA